MSSPTVLAGPLLSPPTLLAVPEVMWRRSPHHDARPAGSVPRRVVLHSDAAPSIGSCINHITNPASKVAYHVSISAAGSVYQHVPWERRAWHAKGFNADTIGVNLSNPQRGRAPFPELQLEVAAAVIAWIIMPACPFVHISGITTHHILDPGRRFDPAPAEPTFQLDRFIRRVEAYHAAGRPR